VVRLYDDYVSESAERAAAALEIEGSIFERERATFETFNETFQGAQVWKEYFLAPRDKIALTAMQSEADFVIRAELIRVSAWVVLAQSQLMLWSRRGRVLNRFASIPRDAVQVVGLQWDTPNLIVDVSMVSGGVGRLAFSPDDGRYRVVRNVIRKENAYRRAAEWIASKDFGMRAEPEG
jgi:hypothetical protein